MLTEERFGQHENANIAVVIRTHELVTSSITADASFDASTIRNSSSQAQYGVRLRIETVAEK